MGIATDLPGYVLAKYDMQIEDIETIKDRKPKTTIGG